MAGPMKLWIIRHAKSSWNDAGISDFDRPLNNRGQRDGPTMQRWLKQQNHLPQWVLASDAQRTRQTSEFIQPALETSAPVVFSHQLYLPSIYTMLDVIAETPIEITSLAVISHNPASTHIVNWLVGQPVIDNIPTLGIARLDIESAWTCITAASATLDFISTPKQLCN